MLKINKIFIIPALILTQVLFPSESADIKGRIIGGYSSPNNKLAKHIVSLRYPKFGHLCAGVILNANSILTAAHCLYQQIPGGYKLFDAKSIQVVAGTQNKVEFERTHKIQKVKSAVRWQRYNRSNPASEGDIAILKLVGNLKEDGKTVQRVPLNSESVKPGRQCTAYGWGETEASSVSSLLQYADLTVQPTSDCKRYSKVPNGVFCTLHWKKGICSGDSGGPLVCNGQLTGLVAFGVKPCIGASYYTDVYHYSKWIKQNS